VNLLSAGEGNQNRRKKSYRDSCGKLPTGIQRLAKEAFKKFEANPLDPALENHELDDINRGRHKLGSRAVSITQRYRAIYVIDGDTNVWYWIGSHEDYNNFTGRK
jgi:hypothetical protein